MKRTIQVKAFVTPEGKPTCASNFETNEICQFLRTKKFGTMEVCEINDSRLERVDGDGFLIPCDNCIVWSD